MRSRRPSVVGWGVFALTCLFVTAGGLLGANSAVARGRPDDAISALAFTATGALIIHRRRNPLGWLSLLMGLSAVAYAGDSYAGWAVQHHGVGAGWADWLASWVWAPASLSVVTVMLLLVPTGRVPTTRWRPLLVGAWSTIALFTAVAALISQAPDGLASPPVVVPALVSPAQHALPVVIGVLIVLAGACLAGLVHRLRHARGVVRTQLVWICAGGVVTVASVFGAGAVSAPWGTIIQSAGAVTLPACLGVAVLRHNLYEVDPVLRRSLTYGLLAALLAAGAVGLTAVGGLAFGTGRAAAVLSTIGIAILVNPLYRWTRRSVDRVLYGRRGDPYAVLSDLSRRLSTIADPRQILLAVAVAAAEAVRSPHVEVDVRDGLLRITHGAAQPFAIQTQLTFQAAELGWLRLSPRSPGEPFDPRDRMLLDDIASQASAALCAAVTELDLRAARDRLIRAREEERRRLRRDLHDGVGPVLAGLSFTAQAAARALPAHPDRAAELLSAVHTQTSTAVATVRRISRDLQPHMLAELGLAESIRNLCQSATDATTVVSVSLAPELRELPAAIEVTVYHIAAEAITNARRHSGAAHIGVDLCTREHEVRLCVEDDGCGIHPNAARGVGLASMYSRAEELGGRLEIDTSGRGTTIELYLPLNLPPHVPSQGMPSAGENDDHPRADRR